LLIISKQINSSIKSVVENYAKNNLETLFTKAIGYYKGNQEEFLNVL